MRGREGEKEGGEGGGERGKREKRKRRGGGERGGERGRKYKLSLGEKILEKENERGGIKFQDYYISFPPQPPPLTITNNNDNK